MMTNNMMMNMTMTTTNHDHNHDHDNDLDHDHHNVDTSYLFAHCGPVLKISWRSIKIWLRKI